MVGSAPAEVEAVRNSRDLPGMAGFDHELRILASRRQRGNTAPAALPTGESPPRGIHQSDQTLSYVIELKPVIGAAKTDERDP